MSGTVVQEDVAALCAGYDVLAGRDIGALTADELVAAMDGLQRLTCQLPTQWHRMLARLQTETTAKEMGAKSWRDVLAIRWRMSTSEANRRLGEAAELGPRQALTGEPLAPLLPAAAAAQAGGLISGEHVAVLRDTMHRLPVWVDPTTRSQIEVDLVRLAVGVGPKELAKTAERRLFLLDQDGPEPDDTERARKRGVSVGGQGRDAMSQVSGHLTPEARATWEAIFAKFAAPGMCNPDDPEPCVSGTPSQAHIDNDHRSLAQRQHDAFVVIGRIALMGGDLGQLNGLPVSIIIRTTLQDLESRAGVGTTGGGTVVPITDVIRLAAHANHFLAVFDKATGSAMDLFRARRTASPAQRIMLIGRDGGCTKPCCTVGPYGSQVHHATADWADDGQTNVDDMTLACGPDNRMVGPDGWTTTINDRGEVEWTPPPHLDTGQTRINYYHCPERLLRPPEEPEPTPDDRVTRCSPEPLDPGNDDDDEASAQAPCDPESFDPCGETNTANTVDPVDPAAPDDHFTRCEPELLAFWGLDTPADTTDTADPTPPDNRVTRCEPELLAFWGLDTSADTTDTADTAAPAPPETEPEPLDPWAPIDVIEPAPPDEQDMRRVTELLDPWGDNDTVVPDELAPPEPDQHPRFTPEPFNPWEIDTPAEPGGPAPPDDQAD